MRKAILCAVTALAVGCMTVGEDFAVGKVSGLQIGKTTPRDVTTYQEGEAHTAFVGGNAAFMRNWPYAYSIGADPKESKIVGKFSVTVLPHGPGGKPVGTVWFGWAWREGDEIESRTALETFGGDREAVRRQTVQRALGEILKLDV